MVQLGSKGKRHKSFPEEENKGKLRAQSQRIKELEKEVARLKSELKTVNKAFEKSAVYMSDQSKLLKVEELIKAADKHQSLKEAKAEFMPTQKEEAERSREETRKKFAEWAKKNRACPAPEEE